MMEIFKIISGILLLLMPFLLTFGCKNRRQGFFCILSAAIAFHITIALLTQALHIFIYPVILGIHLAVALSIIFIIFKKREKFSFKFPLNLRVNWLIIAAGLIIFFNLYSVHYNYSGTINTINGPKTVENNYYPYPYFSDEWVGVSYLNYSINQNSLPTVNPLINGWLHSHTPNVFVAFFASLAELCLFLNILPLTGYAILALGAGLIICFLIYCLMRENGVEKFPALIAVMSLPYIASGANLPGLWYLLPFTGGMIMFLLGLIALSGGQTKKAIADELIALIFYPPLIIFIAPIFLTWLIINHKKITSPKKIHLIASGVIPVLLAAGVIFLLQGTENIKYFWSLIISYLWRPNLDFGIASLPVWLILPFWLLPFVLIGLIFSLQRKKYLLLAPLLTGLSFWIFYSRSLDFFIIDYARTVIISSWLMIVFAGFGLGWTLKKLEELAPVLSKKWPRLVIKLLIIGLFLTAAFSYTSRNVWQKLVLVVSSPSGEERLLPAPPANEYLSEEDLKLMPSNTKKRFLAPSWKGLVIGVATDNYPLDSKPSIVTNQLLSYGNFMRGNCQQKTNNAKKVNAKYIYSQPFNCPDFKLIGSSQEKFYLYEFLNK